MMLSGANADNRRRTKLIVVPWTVSSAGYFRENKIGETLLGNVGAPQQPSSSLDFRQILRLAKAKFPLAACRPARTMDGLF